MIGNALSEDVSFRDVQNREKGHRTMSDVFVLVVSGQVGFGRQWRRDAFEGLDPSAFIEAEQVLVGAFVNLDDVLHLLEKERIGDLQEVLASMRP